MISVKQPLFLYQSRRSDQRTLHCEWIVACEAQRFAAGEDEVADLICRWSDNAGEAKGFGDRGEIDIEHFAADDRLTIFGNEPGDRSPVTWPPLLPRPARRS